MSKKQLSKCAKAGIGIACSILGLAAIVTPLAIIYSPKPQPDPPQPIIDPFSYIGTESEKKQYVFKTQDVVTYKFKMNNAISIREPVACQLSIISSSTPSVKIELTQDIIINLDHTFDVKIKMTGDVEDWVTFKILLIVGINVKGFGGFRIDKKSDIVLSSLPDVTTSFDYATYQFSLETLHDFRNITFDLEKQENDDIVLTQQVENDGPKVFLKVTAAHQSGEPLEDGETINFKVKINIGSKKNVKTEILKIIVANEEGDENFIPLDYLKIVDNVLYGPKVDHRLMTPYNALFVPSSVVQIMDYAFTSINMDGNHINEIIFDDGEYPLYLESESFFELSSVKKVKLPKRIALLPSKTFDCCPIETIDISSWDANKFISGSPFAYGNPFDVILKGTILLSEDVRNNYYWYAYETFRGLHERFAEWFDKQPAYEDDGTFNYYIGDNEKVLIGLVQPNTIEQLTIPEDYTQIGSNAFKGDTKLKRMEAKPNSLLKKINMSAFNSCEQLIDVSIGSCHFLDGIDTSAFRGCNNLLNVNFPAELKSIGSYCFDFCTKLYNINLDQTNVTRIEDYAFQNCNFGEEFKLAKKLEWIGAYAFCSNEKIKSISIPFTTTYIGHNAFERDEGIESFEIAQNSNLKFIGEKFIKGCYRIKKIHLPKSVSIIGAGAFADLDKMLGAEPRVQSELTTLTVDAENPNYFSDGNAIYVKDSTVKDSTELVATCYGTETIRSDTTVIWPEAVAGITYQDDVLDLSNTNIKIIEGQAFYRCNNIGDTFEIKLPSTITTLGTDCFAYSSVTKVDLSNLKNIEKIGYGIFQYSKIADVTLFEGITEISDYMFTASKLKALRIPKSVMSIGKIPFYNANDLSIIDLREFESVPPWSIQSDSFEFYSVPQGAKVLISDMSLEAEWKELLTRGGMVTNEWTFAIE